ncbi:MAG: PEP-CTERM sorting domain-containing protein [Moorea sp. SIO3I7]|uniref:Ice-binding protein C-terminal domain-containing protein n=1 Tax=Moorena bouillonii PNG TaxID=568701 RepID=A0A1U7N8K6_9CYAN|nr:MULTISPECIES: PEP-CTERM sorting domain-containing protein [Moorena]NEN96771.1 PEP-CTERM sorting domain-containing protein [Moorena sp. SIO3I7]NEO44574.1 PEP-CTERM sorting domain-containing protein [Moorena sp. SIO4A3]NEO60760.1 PEP-CTERM sorting domain-containing protein [Moorena sp. SIO4G2]NEO10484.1 PEP-CTERM sorting domain-containing protein [Moorena sp. SIO3I8]NEO12275.1 PEP-CTERM sorting domain-containing protein [Moorena sp. SIO3E8]
MTIKTLTKVATAIVGGSLSLGVVGINFVEAATVKYNFTVNLEKSFFLTGSSELDIAPNPDYYNGEFTFDDSSLTKVGAESLGVDDGLSITLFSDPRINEEDDERFPDFPTVNFLNGELLGLDYDVVYHPFTAVGEFSGDFFRFSNGDFTDGFDPTFYTPEDEPRQPILGSGTVTYTLVPEPTTLMGMLGLGGWLFASTLKRRKQS